MGGVDDVLVDFVGDDEGIEFQGQFRDEGQFPAGEHPAGGIRRVAQNQGLGVLGKGRPQFVGIEFEGGGVQGHVDGLGAGKDRIRPVVFVERRKDDDLVSRVAGRHHGDHHGFGAAAGDDDMGVGIQVEAHPAALFAGQGLAECGRPPGDGVLVVVPVHGVFGRRHQFRRRIEIRKSLGKIDGTAFVGHAGHLPDDRFGEVFQALGCLWHDCRFL